MMIRKIHYCWFGNGPKPELAHKCIESWKNFFPEYDIVEWNESNFDINMIPFTQEAYSKGKYAFVSDYARLWIIYNYGGIYFDTDVEVIKSMNDIIDKGGYMGVETDNVEGFPMVNPGLGMAVEPKSPLIKEIMEIYENTHFILDDGSVNLTTIVVNTTKILKKYGLKLDLKPQLISDIYIYPQRYFNPKTYYGELNISEDTYSIHHFAASWMPFTFRVKKMLISTIYYIFGKNNVKKIYKTLFHK